MAHSLPEGKSRHRRSDSVPTLDPGLEVAAVAVSSPSLDAVVSFSDVGPVVPLPRCKDPQTFPGFSPDNGMLGVREIQNSRGPHQSTVGLGGEALHLAQVQSDQSLFCPAFVDIFPMPSVLQASGDYDGPLRPEIVPGSQGKDVQFRTLAVSNTLSQRSSRETGIFPEGIPVPMSRQRLGWQTCQAGPLARCFRERRGS